MSDHSINKQFGELVTRLLQGHSLPREEAWWAFSLILENKTTDLQQGAFLAALRAKGESTIELGAAWEAILELDTVKVEGIDPEGIVENCGTGVDDQQLAHKQKVLEKVWAFHHLGDCSAWEVLCRVGGFEIAGMAGAAMAATAEGVCVVLDGVISTAAGLVATALVPGIEQFFIISHQSVEHAQHHAARHLELEPLFNLNLRLGEGSGAAIAINLVETACSIFNDMASFDDARVSGRG